MAHQIMGERFIGRVRPAWHGLGTTFAEDRMILASEAVEEIAGDIKVDAHSVYFEKPDGSYEKLPSYQAIIREPTKDDAEIKVLGVTTERWHAVNYPKLARAMDELSKTYKVETCGLIQGGATCFLSLRGPDFSVKGDEMQDYFVANLSNQPGEAHKILAAPVRVVCFNTNMLAASKASINLSIPHSADAPERLALASKLVAQFKEMTKRTREYFEDFAEAQIDTVGLNRILGAAFPHPPLPAELRLFQNAISAAEAGAIQKAMGENFNRIAKLQDTHDKDCERSDRLRMAGVERFEAFDPAKLRGTVWAAYNAATEVSDWREGRGAEVASVWGGRAREKSWAFAEALQVAGMN